MDKIQELEKEIELLKEVVKLKEELLALKQQEQNPDWNKWVYPSYPVYPYPIPYRIYPLTATADTAAKIYDFGKKEAERLRLT